MKNSKKLLIGGLIAVVIVSVVAVIGTGSGDELLGRVNLKVKRNTQTPANMDFDRDGLTIQQENNIGTDPLKRDTDGDGYSDGVEVGEAYQVSWGETPSFIDPELVSDPLDPCDPNPLASACLTQGVSVERR